MTVFRTTINIPVNSKNISHQSRITMLGSCFAQNIGERLCQLKFNINLNPFGVLFNPASIAQSIERLLTGKPVEESELFFANDLWHSFAHHGSFSATDKTACLKVINDQLSTAALFFSTTNTLIITWGTAWVYELIASGEIVANCHKLPDKHFKRRLLSVNEITQAYQNLISRLHEIIPNLHIILTISPVRHLKDGAQGNQLSKAHLIVAANELANSGLVSYFPAYEIMLDDLRDYRFYATDMVHPSELAIDYIFEKFASTFFNNETKAEIDKISIIIKALGHRPQNPHSALYIKFREQTLNKIAEIEARHPEISFVNEKKALTEIL